MGGSGWRQGDMPSTRTYLLQPHLLAPPRAIRPLAQSHIKGVFNVNWQ